MTSARSEGRPRDPGDGASGADAMIGVPATASVASAPPARRAPSLLQLRITWQVIGVWLGVYGAVNWALTWIVQQALPDAPRARWLGVHHWISAASWLPVVFLVILVCERWPIRRARQWPRALAQLALGLLLCTLWGALVRTIYTVLEVPIGMRRSFWSSLAADAKGGLLGYLTTVALAHILLRIREQRARERQIGESRRRLAEARAQMLMLSLETEGVLAAVDTALRQIPSATAAADAAIRGPHAVPAGREAADVATEAPARATSDSTGAPNAERHTDRQATAAGETVGAGKDSAAERVATADELLALVADVLARSLDVTRLEEVPLRELLELAAAQARLLARTGDVAGRPGRAFSAAPGLGGPADVPGFTWQAPDAALARMVPHLDIWPVIARAIACGVGGAETPGTAPPTPSTPSEPARGVAGGVVGGVVGGGPDAEGRDAARAPSVCVIARLLADERSSGEEARGAGAVGLAADTADTSDVRVPDPDRSHQAWRAERAGPGAGRHRRGAGRSPGWTPAGPRGGAHDGTLVLDVIVRGWPGAFRFADAIAAGIARREEVPGRPVQLRMERTGDASGSACACVRLAVTGAARARPEAPGGAATRPGRAGVARG